jgi:hypothetical protein
MPTCAAGKASVALALFVGATQPGAGLAAQDEPAGINAQRSAKVERILAAVQRQDRVALEREGTLGIPYYLGRAARERTAEPFDIQTLAFLSNCIFTSPNLTGINWFSVYWECPERVALPWSSIATAFKFDDLAISEIRTTPGPPLVRAR